MNLKLKAALWTFCSVAFVALTIFVFNNWPLLIPITVIGVFVAALIFRIYRLILEEMENSHGHE